MKQLLTILIAAILMLALLCGCAQTGTAAEPASEADTMEVAVALLSDIPTTQYFAEEAVAEEDLQTILLAGVNAPSAMNGQPWHFTAITDASVLQKISDDMSMGGPASAAVHRLPDLLLREVICRKVRCLTEPRK